MDDALVAEPGPTTPPPAPRPAPAVAPAAPVAVAVAARRAVIAHLDGPLLTIDPVPLPDPVPAGGLPPPTPSPFAVLPAPVWCVIPAVGWQQRATRPIVAPLPTGQPAPAGPPEVTVANAAPTLAADRIVEVVPVGDGPVADEVDHLFPDGWPDAWDDHDGAGHHDRDHHDRDHHDDATLEADDVDDDAAGRGVDPDDAPAAPPAHAHLVRHLHSAARWASFAVLGATVWVLLLTTVPRLFGWQPTVITGHSMEPSIARGDVVVVRPAPAAAYVPGAVVTFSDLNRPGHLITHRIVKVNDDGTLVTKGDNNHDTDPQATPVARVKGRAVLRVPLVGRPVVWVMDRSWLPLALTGAVLFGVIRTLLHPGGAPPTSRRPRRWMVPSFPRS